MAYEVSVLMSTYNEDEHQLRLALDSVINQTFKDFEFIIINDNPENLNLQLILKEYLEKDKRVSVYNNEENIGLAASLNKAASVATGKYLVRMDADDISDLTRFEKQINFMRESNFDLVWTNCFFIDEYGSPIDKSVNVYDPGAIKKLLPLGNIICHPAVMIKSEIFHRIGGYRNFPCAQDYDMWLRMLDENCTFYMIREKLLHYRIRLNGITGSNKLKHRYTVKYIKWLHKTRKETGVDTYDHFTYQQYLNRKKVDESKEINNFEKQYQLFLNGNIDIKNKKYVTGLTKLAWSIICSDYYRETILEKLQFRFKSIKLKA